MAAWVRSGFDPAYAPSHIGPDESEELRDWLPPGWDPDAFSVEETNRELQGLTARDTSAFVTGLPDELRRALIRLDPETGKMVQHWLTHEGWEHPVPVSEDDAVAITRRWRTVLDAVGDGVKLTAAGWLPPSLVKTIPTELDLDDSVCRVLACAGWRLEDGSPLAPYALWRTAYDTRRILHDRLDLAAGHNVDGCVRSTTRSAGSSGGKRTSRGTSAVRMPPLGDAPPTLRCGRAGSARSAAR